METGINSIPCVLVWTGKDSISRGFHHHPSISDCGRLSQKSKENMLPCGKFKVPNAPMRRQISNRIHPDGNMFRSASREASQMRLWTAFVFPYLI